MARTFSKKTRDRWIAFILEASLLIGKHICLELWGNVDPRDTYSYIVFTKSRIGLWKFFELCFLGSRLSWAGYCPFQAANEHLLADKGPLVSHSSWRPPRRLRKAGQYGKFQDLRAMGLIDNKRAETVIPQQDERILSCIAWFSTPRKSIEIKNIGRERTQQRWRNNHGSARAIENLRGVRLSLVSHPDSRECLLPGV
jgi:hypothetical protein